jgi:F-type H+-transporting ATPase subunit epsilon
MADRIQFELVSPERLLLSQAVEMVVLPGTEGDFGALPEHAPTVAALRPGVISVFENGQVIERVFVAGGFAEVTPERCTVLAERALRVAELERAGAERAIANGRDDLAEAKTDAARAAAEHEIAVGEAAIAAMETNVY